MEQGWVKLYRKVEDNDFLMTDNTACLLFFKLLIYSNRKTGKYRTGRKALADRANLNQSTVYKALLRLESNGIVSIVSNARYSIISINNWILYQSTADLENKLEHEAAQVMDRSSNSNITDQNLIPVTASVTTNEQLGNSSVTLEQERRSKNKENNLDKSKLAKPVYGNPEINELFSFWETTIGYKIRTRVQKNRNACSTLIKQHGADDVRAMIGGVGYSHGQRYAPSVTNFEELLEKWDKLKIWGHKHKSEVAKGRTYKV